MDYVHSGTGALNANSGSGTQTNNTNSGSGNQIIGGSHTTYISADNKSQERKEVLNFISRLKFRSVHLEKRSSAGLSSVTTHDSATDNTGTWLFQTEHFREWLSRKTGKRRLWYHGVPGAGKSVMVSNIVSYLQNEFAKQNLDLGRRKLAYVYLVYGEEHSAEDLVGSIVRQLAETDDPLPDCVKAYYESQQKIAADDDHKFDLPGLLQDLCKQSSVYIVVDGLDELSKENRNRFIRYLKGVKEGHINILIMSRLLDEFDDQDGLRLSDGFVRVLFEADTQDLDIFLTRQLEAPFRCKLSDELRRTIREEISKKFDGMFLLANLHMRALKAQHTAALVRKTLETLPSEINETYEQALERVQNQEPGCRILAIKVLAWIRDAQRILTLAELQHALALRVESEEENDIDPESIHEAKDIEDVCGGLVKLTPERVTFVHLTAEDFFRFRSFAEDHSHTALVCARYINLKSLERSKSLLGRPLCIDLEDGKTDTAQSHSGWESDPESSDDEPAQRRLYSSFRLTRKPTFTEPCKRYPLLLYATTYLGHHLRQVSDSSEASSVLATMLKFMNQNHKRELLYVMLKEQGLYRAESTIRGPELDAFSLLHDDADSSFSSDMADSSSSEANPPKNGQDSSIVSSIPSALHLAAFLGWQPLVVSLIEQGDDINMLDSDGRSAIEIAVQAGHLEVVKLLLDQNATIDLTKSRGHDILLIATHLGHFDVVKLILDQPLSLLRRIDSFASGDEGADERLIVLYLAALFALLIRIMAALKFPASQSSNSTSLNGAMPMVENMKDTLVPYLQLLKAVADNEVDTVQHLFSSGKLVQSSFSANFYRTSLFIAVELGRTKVAQVLLEHEVHVDAKDYLGRTCLHRAALRNDASMVMMLLKHKATVDVRDHNGYTPFTETYRRADISRLDERQQVLKLLLDHDADPNSVDAEKCAQIYTSTAAGHIDKVRFLLDIGVDPSWRTCYGWAPLHWCGDYDIAKLLLEKGAEVSPLSDTGKTPLDMAIEYKRPNIVALLRSHKAVRGRDKVRSVGDRDWSLSATRQSDDVNRALKAATAVVTSHKRALSLLPCRRLAGADDLRCDTCREYIQSGLYWHCCQCDDDLDICMDCHTAGKFVEDCKARNHVLGLRQSAINDKSSVDLALISQLEERLAAKLSIPMSASELNNHHLFVCDGCQRSIRQGLTFHCQECEEYHICSRCYHQGFNCSGEAHVLIVAAYAYDCTEETQFVLDCAHASTSGSLCKHCDTELWHYPYFHCCSCSNNQDNYDICYSCYRGGLCCNDEEKHILQKRQIERAPGIY